MSQGVITSFERVEYKYFLTPAQEAALSEILKDRMAVDEYGKHTISNLFFDTDTYEITRASIEKPVYKEKLRVRAYGVPDPETGTVFVELKKKFDGVVYKRRIPLTVPEARAFLDRGVLPSSADPQITREIAHFLNLHHPRAKVFLCYDRVAMFCREDPDLRITMDRNLRWRDTDLTLCTQPWGQNLLEDDRILMEIKVPGVMPLWLARALSDLKIFRTSFSKIGACYKTCIVPQKFTMKAVNQPCSVPSSQTASPSRASSFAPASPWSSVSWSPSAFPSAPSSQRALR